MAILDLSLDWCVPLNIRNVDYLICIFSYSFKIRTRFAQCNKLMHLFQLRFLMKIYIHNFMVLLLLTQSVEPSLGHRGDDEYQVWMTKDARVLNVNATKFKVLLHASEREEQSEARVGTDGLSRGGSLRGVGLDAMLDCIELTKEMIQ